MTTDQKDEFVSFIIHGVKERDADQLDELLTKLVSSRGDLNKVRKDGFYFSLFLLRLLDDLMSRQQDRTREDIREIVQQELAGQRTKALTSDEELIKSFTSLDDDPITEEQHHEN